MQVTNTQRGRAVGLPVRFRNAALLLIALMIAQAGAMTLEGQKANDTSGKIYREGLKALRSGHYEDAINNFSQISDSDSRKLQARLWTALAHLKSQNYRLCFDEASEVLKLDPKSARAYALCATALLRSGHVGKAIEQLNEAFKLDQKEPMAFWAAAEIDYYEGRAADARSRAYQAHLLDPQEPDYVLTFAHASSRLELFKDAAEALELFLDLAPKNDTDRRESIKGVIKFYRKLSGLKIHEVSGPEMVALPFQLRADRRPYVKLKVNGRDATFVIDTGSGFTVISEDAAKRLNVSEVSRGGKSQAFGGDGKFAIVYGLVKSLQMGGAQIKSVPCYIRPFHASASSTGGEHTDGYIGLSILSHFLTELDYKQRELRLDRSAGASLIASPGATIVPFRRTTNGLVSIETEFDGSQQVNAILDSGASSTVISSAAVARLNMAGQIIKGETTRVFGAAGISDNVALLRIGLCRVANLQRSNLRALVLDFGAINETSGFEQAGILGGDFLMNFRITLDFKGGLVAFHPPAETLPRRDYQ